MNHFPDSFKEGYRGILLIRRNKDGQRGNAQRRALKRITNGVEQWNEAVAEFAHMQQTSHIGYRIYASVNYRNMNKAIHEFKRRQIEFDYGNNRELDEFYRDIENRFFSCLMQPGCRNQNYFLVDCDSLEEYEEAKRVIDASFIVHEYPTRSGHHIITKPFNPNDYALQIKKDDLLFVS